MLDLDYGSESGESGDETRSEKPSSTGLLLPPPTKSSRRKDGPIRIKVDAIKPEKPGEPTTKKARRDNDTTTRGAGTSSLVSMLSRLPAPTHVAPKPVKPARVLGGGAQNSGDSPGVIMEPDGLVDLYPQASSRDSSTPSDTPATSFAPSSVTRPKAKPLLRTNDPKGTSSMSLQLDTPAVDFFGIGNTSHPSRSIKPAISDNTKTTSSMKTSAAPAVIEFQPPPPTLTDPYPGYYQKPSGEYAPYDPVYYSSFWASWQVDNGGVAGRDNGKRKERGWEVTENDLQDVDARQELERGRIAEREAQKNLTAAQLVPKETPKMNIKVGAGNNLRKKGQLSSLLVEAYQNREAIEEQIAAGRRNRKESGMKYGF